MEVDLTMLETIATNVHRNWSEKDTDGWKLRDAIECALQEFIDGIISECDN